ncbi:uncharacterized protein ACR2FA_012255 [Aphomia sociella]
MSDDIDIEEHDILNNPLIKTIFPDLSILKKEILDFEEVPESETELPHKTSISDEINAITDYPDVRKTEIQEYTGFQFNNNQIVTKLVEESESDLVRLHSNKKVLSKYGNNEKFKNFSTLHADKEKTKEICFKLDQLNQPERKSDYFSSQKIKESALVHNKEEKDTNIGANISRLRFLIFKSVLFKCSKCDIHFLSLETALSHSEHMEILVNWKCSVCMKIFKQNDEVLHKKQHLSCDLFTVYDTSELNVSLILYKCSKCTVHYDETNYREHYSDCELKTPNASYCIVCDILLDNHVMKSHESEHKLHNLTPTDFTIIDCDILLEEIEIVCNENHPSEKTNIESLKKMQNERFRYIIDKNKLLVKSFCSTCKCFVSNVGWLRKVHIQSRCQHLTKHVCIYCGLLLTSKTLATHKNMHRRKTKISLQDFKFFDLKSGKRIIPPIPEYPKCEICDIHFISKLAIKNHICSDHEFSTCSVCFVKLSRPVLKLHMAFHNYTLKKKIKILSYKSNSNKSVSSEEETRNFEPQNSQISNDDLSQLFKGKKLFFLYRCRTCSITLNTYDKMIHHCHLHYNNLEHEIKTEICNYCQLTFEIGCYESHKLSHSNTFYKRLFKKFEFDIFYFKFDGDIWTKHVFGSLPQEKINEARAESIYQYEHRIKMHIVQDGPFDMTVYKCDSCNCIIEPELIYKHIEIDCLDLRKHVCVFCGLTFLSLLLKRSHENIHKRTGITSKSFRIILFNQNADKVYNSMFSDANNYYILYQCRTCSIVVNKYQTKNHKCSETELKRCSDCGLLFDDNEYESHLIKHKDFDSFIPENMKLVLFGKLIEKDNIPKKVHKKFAPFRGAVYNYTFYKCSNCEVYSNGQSSSSEATIREKSWMFKYPKTFQITFTVLSLGIFFSKPIYDIFIRPREDIDLSEPPTSLRGLYLRPLGENSEN